MPIELVINARVPVKVWTGNVEPEAIEQLRNVAALPVVHPHVAAMADVHLGKGATIGSVVPTREAVCPAAVGVDIGCGMSAQKTSIPADRLTAEDRKELRHSIDNTSLPSAVAWRSFTFCLGVLCPGVRCRKSDRSLC